MKRFVRSYKSSAIMLAVLLYIMYETPAAPKSNEVVYSAVDYGFSGPDSIPAGWTTLRIENRGKDLHHVLLVQLLEGKTRADFVNAFKADPMMKKPPKWVKFAGGPNAIVSGEVETATVNLDPGSYLLICVVPGPGGAPHFTFGMMKDLTVTSASKQLQPEPKAEGIIELNDFAFAIPKPLSAGNQIIEVHNKGNQKHEVVLVQLPPNTTIEEFGRHFLPNTPNAGVPPPAKPVGGIIGLSEGGHAYFTANLTPGHYGLICFMPDTAGAGEPHFTKGMMADFTIQ